MDDLTLPRGKLAVSQRLEGGVLATMPEVTGRVPCTCSVVVRELFTLAVGLATRMARPANQPARPRVHERSR